MDKIYVVLLNLRSHPMHSARCPTRDIVISWIHIAWTNLEVSQLRQCRVSAPQLGESIQEGLPLFHGIKWAEIQPIFPPLICWPATFIQCAVCTGFIRLDWVCISHYFHGFNHRFPANLQLTEIWWMVVTDGDKVLHRTAPSHTLYPLLCSVIYLLSSAHHSQSLSSSHHSKSLNMTNFAQWMPCRSLKMRLRAVEKKCKILKQGNPDEKLGRDEWTNRVCMSGQIGCATKSAPART